MTKGRVHWPFLLGIFVILGVGVSALHVVQSYVTLPNWLAGLLLAGLAFVVLGFSRWLRVRDEKVDHA